MHQLEQALIDYLIDAETAAGSHVYPVYIPPNITLDDWPVLTIQQITNQGHHDIDVEFPRYQVSAWSPRLIEAKQLAQEVEGLLRRFKGIMNGVRVTNISKQATSPGVIQNRDHPLDPFHVPTDYKIIVRSD